MRNSSASHRGTGSTGSTRRLLLGAIPGLLLGAAPGFSACTMPFGGDPSRSPSHDYRGDDDPYTSDGQPVGANNRPATDSIDHQLAVGQRPRYAGERADDRQGQRSARVTVHPMLSAPCKAMGPVTALQGVLRMEACKAGETCPKRVTLVTEEKTWHLGIDPHFNAQRGRRVQLRGRACSDGEHFESASMTPLK